MKTETGVGIKVKIDNLGRIVIPKQYRDFYHLNNEEGIFITATTEGLFISNPRYEIVKITGQTNSDEQ